MKLIWKLPRDDVDHEMIWGGIGLVILFAVRFLPHSFFSVLWCPFRAITGYPCPFCGMTRSFISMSHLEIREAFSINPLGVICFLLMVPFLVYALISVLFRTRRLRIELTRRWEGNLARILVILSIAVQWGYQLWR